MISEEQRAGLHALFVEGLEEEIERVNAWQLTPEEQALKTEYAAIVATWLPEDVAGELGNKLVERCSQYADPRRMTIYIAVLAAEYLRRAPVQDYAA